MKGLRFHTVLLRSSLLAVLALAMGASEALAGTLRIAAVSGRDTSHVQAVESMAAIIEEQSGGQVRGRVLHSGAFGSETEALKAELTGKLEGSVISATTLAHAMPSFRVLTLPGLFPDDESVQAFVGSPMDQALRKAARRKKLVVLGYASFGFHGILTREGEYDGGPSMGSLRVPQDDWMVSLYHRLGFSPRRIPGPEVGRLLREGALSSLATSAEGVAGANVAQPGMTYYTTRHLNGWMVITVRSGWYYSLSSRLQTVVEGAGRQATYNALRQSASRTGVLLERMQQQGVTVRDPAPAWSARLEGRMGDVLLQDIKRVERVMGVRKGLLLDWWNERHPGHTLTWPEDPVVVPSEEAVPNEEAAADEGAGSADDSGAADASR